MDDISLHNQDTSASQIEQTQTHTSWRTESEISGERQRFLRQCLLVAPDVQQGVYPFREISLTRADIEWLLTTHEQGHGPIEWSKPEQRAREGIDLRGARMEHVDLRNLPIACLRGGLTQEEWVGATLEQRDQAGVHLERADLSGAHLEGAILRGAFLQDATLRGTFLAEAVLFQAHLERAYLRQAHLERANMMYAHLEGTYLRKAWLMGTDLRQAICDHATNLERVTFTDPQWGCALFADIHWNNCNLSIIRWQHMLPLGDETLARRAPGQQKRASNRQQRLSQIDSYRAAVRAHRQLASVMQSQGMNDEAVPFAYRAQLLQRVVLWQEVRADALSENRVHVLRGLRQRIRGLSAWLFSCFLDGIAGYGYKPERSLLVYLFTIVVFAFSYVLLAHLQPVEALIFSVTAFHGRGFFPGSFPLDNPVTALAALEAVVGLLIEISFIATFTQRFLEK
jgi:uncharacterized protein YjbI with pentapeptide repeats